jgi:hypothetical protein
LAVEELYKPSRVPRLVRWTHNAAATMGLVPPESLLRALGQRQPNTQASQEACRLFKECYSRTRTEQCRTPFHELARVTWSNADESLFRSVCRQHAESFFVYMVGVKGSRVALSTIQNKARAVQNVEHSPSGNKSLDNYDYPSLLLCLSWLNLMSKYAADDHCAGLLAEVVPHVYETRADTNWSPTVFEQYFSFCLVLGIEAQQLHAMKAWCAQAEQDKDGSATADCHDWAAKVSCASLIFGQYDKSVEEVAREFWKLLAARESHTAFLDWGGSDRLRLLLFAFSSWYRASIACLALRRAWLANRRLRPYEVEAEVAAGQLYAQFDFEDLVKQLAAFSLRTQGNTDNLLRESLWQAYVEEQIGCKRLRLTLWQKLNRGRCGRLCVLLRSCRAG